MIISKAQKICEKLVFDEKQRRNVSSAFLHVYKISVAFKVRVTIDFRKN